MGSYKRGPPTAAPLIDDSWEMSVTLEEGSRGLGLGEQGITMVNNHAASTKRNGMAQDT